MVLKHPRKGNIAVTEKAEAKKVTRFNRLYLTGWALHLYRDIEILMPIICLRSNGDMPVVEKLDWDHFKSRSLCYRVLVRSMQSNRPFISSCTFR